MSSSDSDRPPVLAHQRFVEAAKSFADLNLAQRFRRAAPNPAPPTILAVPRDADVRRFEMLSSGFAAVLELPFDKRRLFNVLHSVAAGDEVTQPARLLPGAGRRSLVCARLFAGELT